ncbi:MAG: DEAD/DEAH box helicase [Elusimicrobia bacterium]|nr:DEAD/DEAH box helicase [Elusimicrobiota bacterium]
MNATSSKSIPIRNSFHPYLFLRFIYPQAPEGKWLVLFHHELEARDFLRETEALASILGCPQPALSFLPDTEAAPRQIALRALAEGEIRGIAATPFAVEKKCASLDSWSQRAVYLKTGSIMSREELIRRLMAFGFHRADAVEGPGEFAVRGQILDCFTAADESPMRLVFNGDSIESIRVFDIETQLTSSFRPSALIIAAAEGSGGSLKDYAREQWNLVWERPDLQNNTLDFKVARQWVFASLEAQAQSQDVTVNHPYAGNVGLFLKQAVAAAGQGYKIHLVAPTAGDEERSREILEEAMRRDGLRSELHFHWSVAAMGSGVKDEPNGLWLVNTSEIFSRMPVKISPPAPMKPKKGRKAGQTTFQRSLLELKLGEYVVHEVFGIARYRGLEKVLDMEGNPRGEFVRLDFAKSDKLFLNPEEMHFIHRYVTLGARQSPRLSSLDARSFALVKSRVREEAKKFCERLLKLWAKRSALPAPSLSASSHWEKEFAESFPYEETEDQKKAIEEIIGDLEEKKPMERLLLGDVGFGKTEVALRAAFRTAANGKQVVVLAPTTVLAEQHYRNFAQRFAPYPMTLGLFSRFVKPAQVRRQLAALAQGKLDIAVGTHRLLQKDVRFKDLGLLIVDEEHRFGVRDKERLKFLSSQVHTLYCSATPIPRTLSSALSGMKGISIIETPPVGRLPIETVVGPWDKAVIERALRYELGRGGQVFYVFNDIARLPEIVRELEQLVDGLRASVCHGQMSASSIEGAMQRFLSRESDVLVASSIIESGLDIPTVNTLIIEGAENFGLAQLYQIRGRIGRKDLKAYAYLFYPRGRRWDDLSATAQERLRAVRDFAQLGSGMRLALRDLEIRGAGEILGTKQHGFVSRVGLELYSKLIQEEMDKLKEGRSDDQERPANQQDGWPKIHLDFSSYLPEDYVSSEMERVSYYRRLSGARTEAQINLVFEELHDRAGAPPAEAKNLRTFFLVRLLGRQLGLAVLEQIDGDRLRFEFQDTAKPKGRMVAWLLGQYQERVRFESEKHAFKLALSQAPTPETVEDLTRQLTQLF